jgi:Sec-independent protein translocase protein TatA
VHHAVGLSLIVFVVAVVTGVAAAGTRGLGAWRAFKSFKRNAADRMLETAARIEQLEARTAASGDRAARLAVAQAQLKQSLAEAAVIRQAANEISALVERIRLVAPRN